MVAEVSDGVAGLVTHHVSGDALEIVPWDAEPPGRGVGRALVAAVVDLAGAQRLRRVWR